MARDSTVRTGSIDPTTGTAASSQAVGTSQTKCGKGKNPDSLFRPKRAGSSRGNTDPEPKSEEEDEKVQETPIKRKDPGGDPGNDPDPRGGGGGRRNQTPPPGPFQPRT